MQSITRAPPPDDIKLGLDRAKINGQGDILLPKDNAQLSSPADSGFGDDNDDESTSHLSKRERFSLKAKKILHIPDDSNSEDKVPGPILADAPDAVSNARLIVEPPKNESPTAKDLLHHPVATITSKVSGKGGQQVAANMVAKEVSHGREVELVLAQDVVLAAKTKSEKLLAIKNVDKLMQERQDMFVRWTIDRHVMKVRKLPEHSVPKRDKKDFERKLPDGRVKMDWEGYANHMAKYYAEEYGAQYIGYASEPPAVPDKNMVMPCVERLLVASGPLQGLLMTIRKIYRWENSRNTLAFLFGYLTLWTSDMLLPGFIIGVLYLIIHRRYRGPSIEDLRKDIIRTELLEETALSISEFIDKKGDQKWQDDLIQELGPWALVQLVDVANTMEVLRNFYEWRVPNRTAYTLLYLLLALPIAIFTPTQILIRAITLSMGIVFFALFPISSRFPEYRLLASPIKWLFWNIPTHAEWSIKALQAEGATRKTSRFDAVEGSLTAAQIEHGGPDPLGYRGPPTTKDGKPLSTESTHVPPDAIHGTYDGMLDGRPGKLVVSGVGLKFLAAIGHKDLWSCEYTEIVRVEKVNRIAKRSLKGANGEDLRISVENKKFKGVETEVLFKDLHQRDQLFSQVVGFSEVRWQVAW